MSQAVEMSREEEWLAAPVPWVTSVEAFAFPVRKERERNDLTAVAASLAFPSSLPSLHCSMLTWNLAVEGHCLVTTPEEEWALLLAPPQAEGSQQRPLEGAHLPAPAEQVELGCSCDADQA